MGLADLSDLDPGAPHLRPGPMASARLSIQDLGLVRIAIGILGEQHRPRADHHHGVAHVSQSTRTRHGRSHKITLSLPAVRKRQRGTACRTREKELLLMAALTLNIATAGRSHALALST